MHHKIVSLITTTCLHTHQQLVMPPWDLALGWDLYLDPQQSLTASVFETHIQVLPILRALFDTEDTLQTKKNGLYLSESSYTVNTTILSTFLWPCANPRHSSPKSLVSRLPCLPLRRRLPMADLMSCQCKQDTETHCSLLC